MNAVSLMKWFIKDGLKILSYWKWVQAWMNNWETVKMTKMFYK